MQQGLLVIISWTTIQGINSNVQDFGNTAIIENAGKSNGRLAIVKDHNKMSDKNLRKQTTFKFERHNGIINRV